MEFGEHQIGSWGLNQVGHMQGKLLIFALAPNTSSSQVLLGFVSPCEFLFFLECIESLVAGLSTPTMKVEHCIQLFTPACTHVLKNTSSRILSWAQG